MEDDIIVLIDIIQECLHLVWAQNIDTFSTKLGDFHSSTAKTPCRVLAVLRAVGLITMQKREIICKWNLYC